MVDAAIKQFEVLPEGEYVARIIQVTPSHCIYEVQEGEHKGQHLLLKHPGNIRIGVKVNTSLPLSR